MRNCFGRTKPKRLAFPTPVRLANVWLSYKSLVLIDENGGGPGVRLRKR
jgi:hypothetical protein